MAELTILIERYIETHVLTQAQAAERFGVTQPRMSTLLSGKFHLFSIDSLVEMLARAGAIQTRPDGLAEEFGLHDGGYRLSEAQAQAILDLRLHRLTGLEQDKILAEYGELLELIRDLSDILGAARAAARGDPQRAARNPRAVRRRAPHAHRRRRVRPHHRGPLQQLLQCPRMFLMRRILHWDEPAGAPSLRELDAASYGSLLHRVVEAFYRRHGQDLVARTGSLPEWQAIAGSIADRKFDAFLSEYPLVGEGVRRSASGCTRAWLPSSATTGTCRRAASSASRWASASRSRSRRPPAARPSTCAATSTVDVEGDATIVRDLKSGRGYPRERKEKGPTPVRDVQLGVYQLAARKLAANRAGGGLHPGADDRD